VTEREIGEVGEFEMPLLVHVSSVAYGWKGGTYYTYSSLCAARRVK
jgi:hypothetical protein